MGIGSKKRVQVLTFVSLVLAQLVVVAQCEAADTENRSKSCNGSIAECYGEEELFVDSESSRRILGETRHLTDAALRADVAVGVGIRAQEHRPYSPRPCTEFNRCRTQVYQE